MSKIVQGTWVEIEQVVLRPEERAPSLPVETREVPYLMRVSGFLSEDGEIGEEVHIQTIIGRVLSGTLKIVNPGYQHSFGDTIPELLRIGTEAEQ